MAAAVESLTVLLPSIEEAKRLDAEVDRTLGEASDRASDFYGAMLEIRSSEAWRTLGFKSWAVYAESKAGKARRDIYRQLEAALVIQELESETHKPGLVTNLSQLPRLLPESQLRALSKAPQGTRAEVLKVAKDASGGKPTEKIVKAAVEAKRAEPKATPAELVKTVVNGQAAADKAVEKARAAGRIPAGVTVHVEDPGEAETTVETVAEEHEEQAAKRDEIDDEEWLASLPLNGKLNGPQLRGFQVDAAAYRELEPHRKTFEHFLRRAKAAAVRKTSLDLGYLFRVFGLLLIQHPKDWKPCPSMDRGGCGGSGQIAMMGVCQKCKGRGYILQ